MNAPAAPLRVPARVPRSPALPPAGDHWTDALQRVGWRVLDEPIALTHGPPPAVPPR